MTSSTINISIGNTFYYFTSRIGGITGTNSGTINKCSVTGCELRGYAASKKFDALTYIGGIAAVSSGSSLIQNCLFKNSTIYSKSEGIIYLYVTVGRPKAYAGGIVANSSALTMKNCLSYGNSITAHTKHPSSSDDYSERYGGILIGNNASSTVQNTYSVTGNTVKIIDERSGSTTTPSQLVGSGTSVGSFVTPSGSALTVAECSGFSTSIWADSADGPVLK